MHKWKIHSTTATKSIRTLDMGGDVHLIFCDFQKAFDKVPHRRLIQMLEYIMEYMAHVIGGSGIIGKQNSKSGCQW